MVYDMLISVLNHAEVCVLLDFMEVPTAETNNLREGYWLWVYDTWTDGSDMNVVCQIFFYNIVLHNYMYIVYIPASHRHSSIATAIQNFPDFELSWSDNQPQCSHTSLSINNFLPSESDDCRSGQQHM